MKHSTMIGSYEKGGRKDVDLEPQFQSLRIIWVRKSLIKLILIHDVHSEYSVARFRRCKYFSHKLIDRTGETSVLEKDTDIL